MPTPRPGLGHAGHERETRGCPNRSCTPLGGCSEGPRSRSLLGRFQPRAPGQPRAGMTGDDGTVLRVLARAATTKLSGLLSGTSRAPLGWTAGRPRAGHRLALGLGDSSPGRFSGPPRTLLGRTGLRHFSDAARTVPGHRSRAAARSQAETTKRPGRSPGTCVGVLGPPWDTSPGYPTFSPSSPACSYPAFHASTQSPVPAAAHPASPGTGSWTKLP